MSSAVKCWWITHPNTDHTINPLQWTELGPMLSLHKTSPFSPPPLAHLQHKDLPGSFVDVKLGLVWPVGVNALAGEEVDNILGAVLVTVSGGDLGAHMETTHGLQGHNCSRTNYTKLEVIVAVT